MDAGMDHDQIRMAFMKEYGEQILGAPLDEGFNRLAWALPYVAGFTGAALVGFVAFRWSRKRDDVAETAPAVKQEDALNARLDDELRDLD
jgi:cytochrome c-type biogenesis protein CcmH/NrfF